MSSSRFLRMPSVNSLSAAAALAVLLSAMPASAQVQFAPQAQPQPQPQPRLPGVPAFAPQAAQGQQDDQPSIKLPQGASLGDAQSRVQNLAAEAGKALDGLVGNTVSDREKAQIEALSERKRRILVLEDQLKEAKLAKLIWKELHGEEDKSGEQVKKLEEEKKALTEQVKFLEANAGAAKADPDPLPVVSSISGAAGAAKAVILVPYVGTVHAQAGTLLPNGMKVTSISRGGVVVERDGAKVGLAFGSSVPLVRPKPQEAAPAQRPAPAMPMMR